MPKILTLTWPAGPQSVLVTGSFDSWTEKLPLVKQEDGSFKVTLPTKDDSDIQFKFIVDGEWKTSGDYKSATDNTGNTNNVATASDLDDELTGQDALSAALSTPGIVIAGGAAALGGAAAAGVAAGTAGAAEQEESVGKFTEHIDHDHPTTEGDVETVPELDPIAEEPAGVGALKHGDVKGAQHGASGAAAKENTPALGELNGAAHGNEPVAAVEKSPEQTPVHDYGHTETLQEVEKKLEHPEQLSYHPSDQPREPLEEPVVLDKQVTKEDSIEPLDNVPVEAPSTERAAPAATTATNGSLGETHNAVAPVVEAASGFTAQDPAGTNAADVPIGNPHAIAEETTEETEESTTHTNGELKSLAQVAASYERQGGEVAAEEEYSKEAETAPVDSAVEEPNPAQQNRILQETESKQTAPASHPEPTLPTAATTTESSHARTGSNQEVNVPTLRSKESKKIKKKGFVSKLKSIFH